MDEEKQTSQTDTSESGVNPEEGKGDADESVGSSDALLEKLREVSNRDFKDLDDFEKHYKNLSSMFGDQTIAEQRKLAEKYSGIREEIKDLADREGVDPDTYLEWSIAQAKKLVGQTTEANDDIKEYAKEKIESETLASLKDEVESLRNDSKKRDLLSTVPEANQYYDDFAAWAKGTGKEVNADTFKESPFNALVEADRLSKGSSVIESSSRVAGSDEYEKALRDVRANPSSEEAAQRLVEARIAQMEI